MRVIIESDYQALSQWAANYVASKINAANPTPEKPFVLGCPTGSSPLGMYKALIELNKQGKVSFQNVVTFNMDEYVGLPEDHPESYHTFMWKNFFNHIDIKKENVHILNGNAEDLEAECANYEKQIAEIGLLQHHGHFAAQDVQVVIPHIHAAHLHGAGLGVVQAGDQLHQTGLCTAGAADDAQRLAGLDGKGDIVQHRTARTMLILKGNMVELDAAIPDLLHRLLGRGQVRGLVQHFHDTLGGSGRHRSENRP